MHNKVKMLSCTDGMVGLITNEYRDCHSQYKRIFWVRLKNGILLKDVSDSEIEYIPLAVGDVINVVRYKRQYNDVTTEIIGVVRDCFDVPEPTNPVLCILEDGTEVFAYDDIKCVTIK